MKLKYKIIALCAIIVVLTVSFLYGGDDITEYTDVSPTESEAVIASTYAPVKTDAPVPETLTESPVHTEEAKPTEIPEADKPVITPEPYVAEPSPTAEPIVPTERVQETPHIKIAEKEVAVQKDETLTCSLSVRCDTAVGKVDIAPGDGLIFSEDKVVFYEEETVFNVLVREMKKNKVHLEFVNVLLYNSSYIEGIGNLYEFDCGELSGWMYKVNGIFPDYGSSSYKLNNGDVIEWVYTCDLGKDVGGEYSKMNGYAYE